MDYGVDCPTPFHGHPRYNFELNYQIYATYLKKEGGKKREKETAVENPFTLSKLLMREGGTSAQNK